MMKTLKRCMLAIMLLTFCMSGVTSAHAASTKAKAIKAYKQFLEKTDSKYSFSTIYLDKDSVPELLVHEYLVNVGYVYTYKNGKVVQAGGTGKAPVYYYKKKGIITSGWQFSGGSSGETATAYYQLKGKKLNLVLADVKKAALVNKEWTTVAEYRQYTNASGAYTKTEKKAFNKALKKLTGSRQKVRIKYYQNTAANRKTHVK